MHVGFDTARGCVLTLKEFPEGWGRRLATASGRFVPASYARKAQPRAGIVINRAGGLASLRRGKATARPG